jgi:hypothetical protein
MNSRTFHHVVYLPDGTISLLFLSLLFLIFLLSLFFLSLLSLFSILILFHFSKIHFQKPPNCMTASLRNCSTATFFVLKVLCTSCMPVQSARKQLEVGELGRRVEIALVVVVVRVVQCPMWSCRMSA